MFIVLKCILSSGNIEAVLTKNSFNINISDRLVLFQVCPAIWTYKSIVSIIAYLNFLQYGTI